MISSLVRESRLPVGSSAIRIDGIIHESSCNGDALLLTTGQLTRMMVQAIAQPDAFQQADRSFLTFAPRDISIVQQRQFDVFQRRGAIQEVEVLKNEADFQIPQTSPFRRRHVAHFDTVQVIAARGRSIETTERVHERRFAGARRSDQGDVFATLDRQRDPGQGVDFGFTASIDSS